MSYPETARRFYTAERSTRYGSGPDLATLAADKLPMSEWAEARRDLMTPSTIAANHALHVQGAALELRRALAQHEAAARANGREDADDMTDERERVCGMEAADAARALLAAIGEDTDA